MKRLFTVEMQFQGSLEVPVWADDEDEAGVIARRDAEMWDVETRLVSCYSRDMDERDAKEAEGTYPYGDGPEGAPEDAAKAFDWLTKGSKRMKAEAKARKSNRTLFGIDPRPLPCDECGSRWPEERHEPDCTLAPPEED